MAVAQDRQDLPAADGGGVGVRGAGGHDDAVLGGARRSRPSQANYDGNDTYGGGPRANTGRRRCRSARFAANAFGPLRHARQRLGVGAGLLERQLQRRAIGRLGLDNWRLQSPGPARRFLGQRSEDPPLGLPRRGHHRRPGQRLRLPCREDALAPESLPLYLLGSRGRSPRPFS